MKTGLAGSRPSSRPPNRIDAWKNLLNFLVVGIVGGKGSRAKATSGLHRVYNRFVHGGEEFSEPEQATVLIGRMHEEKV